MENQSPPDTITAPSSLALPKGGGALQGMKQTLAPVGSFGVSECSLPLPISRGRGYAPPLALHYSSGGENGVFGHGWGVNVMRVTRSTRHGVPHYGPEDRFTGPEGEELVAERDAAGAIKSRQCQRYGEQDLAHRYTVTRYYPRTESAFHRLEFWQQNEQDAGFWLLHSANGELHCLGKDPQARLADPACPQHVAEWWLQESLAPDGQQIRYCYRKACQTAALDRVCYGNREATRTLAAWQDTPPDDKGWLFVLLFDYGERSCDMMQPPAWQAEKNVPAARTDLIRRYEYGFARQINLLCRQVLMFHCFDELNGGKPLLINRLLAEYDENPELTRLTAVRSVSYEPTGKPLAIPPLDFRYTPFQSALTTSQWQPFDALSDTDISGQHHWQLVDLYGEGLPGLLYHTTNGWCYRAPQRGRQPDSIIYGPMQQMPATPAYSGAGMALIDLTGDGQLDWIVQQPGLAGYFTLNSDQSWSSFIPFNAWPAEFLDPQAELTDLLGSGLQDLVLIGPKSVRLYTNQSNHFTAPETVLQADGITLPVAGRDVTELVAFSDVLGSGQQHLISIRHDTVTCWPNMGHGKFGQPLVLTGLTLDKQTFNPAQICLADIDGSGAVDIIYAETNLLRIFRNQSGQRFAAEIVLPLPPGVHYDRLCQLRCVDIDGSGSTSLILSVPYMTVRHWRYTFAEHKPYLLAGINNNMGADTRLTYRSSAQFWLDEKQASPQAVCRLPFPVQLLSDVQIQDEITGNRLTQNYRYQRGVYDGIEREFRGFAMVESRDSDENACATGAHGSVSSPTVTRSWYHTGGVSDEKLPAIASSKLWLPYHLQATRLTRWDDGAKADLPLFTEQIPATVQHQLWRSLQGQLLRQELYGDDHSAAAAIPYSITFFRYQLRQIRPGDDQVYPVVYPAQLETLSYHYERIAGDPRVTQSICLQQDAFGAITHSAEILYPRRSADVSGDYPPSLPAKALNATRDDQQFILHINEQQSQFYHLSEPQCWRLHLPDCSWQHALQYPASSLPAAGLSFESLTATGGLLDAKQPRTFLGQTRLEYETTPPELTALVKYTETAEFDDQCLHAFDGTWEGEERTKKLQAAGYVQTSKRSGKTNESIWVARRGYTQRHDEKGFFLPRTSRTSLLSGETRYGWDRYFCALTTLTDAAGHVSSARYDYRFLTPCQLTDINDNISAVALDALGRVIATSFYGSENGKNIGFTPVDKANLPPATPAAILDKIPEKQPVASRIVMDLCSWMGHPDTLSTAEQQTLLALGWLTPDGYLRAVAHRQLLSGQIDSRVSKPTVAKLRAVTRIPVHNALLVADNYPDKAQKIRTQVTFCDGFARELQTATRYESDPQQATAGQPASASPTRWAVSGRVEYNNKGLPVRVYQPFFADDWCYLADNTLRTRGHADIHYYDPLGRETAVHTAKGYLRRNSYYPWFSVAEDENDTWSEVEAARSSKS
ncbi:SpvB/TcaC N-terminal domain-containing protein [Photorhabdus sp. CRCIA-P01]|uniref:SpvB/TcaC N-terminal domain-containing protein n=1 Tax=Photorhabdus sp. CRCIA-P01 TaxID=2019570 RepID=UPI000E5A0846|nr:SpvB/TcaC N-terminal domain-containing protein [Photorhabdus sp. CRCIA-P01]